MKILYVTTIAGTLNFFPEHIKMLIDEGHTVEVAANCYVSKLPSYCSEMGLKVHNLPFSRSSLDKSNLIAYKQLKEVIENENYDIVHTHTPNASVCVRLACRKLRKKGLKVFYTAHGFHFYKGAPFKNWLLYFPVEWLCSFMTDTLITINNEDFEFAKKHLHAKEVFKIPGTGINLEKISLSKFDRKAYRENLGLNSDDLMIISVGELNDNKNHGLVIKTIAALNNEKLHYFIAGAGKKFDKYKTMANELKISKQIHLLGFRKDISELNHSADMFVFPSIREGLGLAALEALACGIPVCGMNTRGITEYVVDGEIGYLFNNSVEDCGNAIINTIDLIKNSDYDLKGQCLEMAKNFSVNKTLEILKEIYRENFNA